MKNQNINPSTSKEVATIKLTKKQKEKISQLVKDIFLKPIRYPSNLRLLVTGDEFLNDDARNRLKDNILEFKE